jgi:Holliday junction resolvase
MAISIKPADNLKSIIIDYLIDNFMGVIIGNEVMYGTKSKVVDLLALYNEETYAIEIKSEKDDLRRLPEQIQEYERIFDHTIIFTTPNHINKITSITKKRISLFEITKNGEVEAKFNCFFVRNLTRKKDMLATINLSYLIKHLNIPDILNSDDMRHKAMRLKKQEIRMLLFSFFQDKLKDSFDVFIKERMGFTTIDDLSVLSNRLKVD